MRGWPRLPRQARSLRTWASLTPRDSPSCPLETLLAPSRSQPSRHRKYKLSLPALARDKGGTAPSDGRSGSFLQRSAPFGITEIFAPAAFDQLHAVYEMPRRRVKLNQIPSCDYPLADTVSGTLC